MRSSKMIVLGALLFATFSANAATDNPPIGPQVKCMAEAVYFEAKSEPVAGKLAVATVIKNRTEEPGYPDTPCKVVNQRHAGQCQFVWVCDGSRRKPKNPQQWEESVEIAEKSLILGESHPIIDRKDGLFFHATTIVKPAWLKTKRVIMRIGHHIFYSEKPYMKKSSTSN